MEYIPPQEKDIEILFAAAEAKRKALQWDSAIKDYYVILRANEKHAGAHLGLGQIFEGKGTRDREPALFLLAQREYEAAVSINPQSMDSHLLLFGLALKQGRIDQLAKEYKERLKKDPENAILKESVSRLTAISLAAIPQRSIEAQRGGCLKRLVNLGLPLTGTLILAVSLFKFRGVSLSGFRPIAYILLGIFFFYKLITHRKGPKTSNW